MPNASNAWPWRYDGGRGVEFKRLGASRTVSSKPTAEARRQRMAVAVVQKLGASRTVSSKPTAEARRQRMAVAWSSKGSEFKRLGVQKARSSEGSAGRKSVNEFKNGKSACLCVRRMSAAPCAPSALPPSGRRTGRDGNRGSPRKGRAAENFRPLLGLMIS